MGPSVADPRHAILPGKPGKGDTYVCLACGVAEELPPVEKDRARRIQELDVRHGRLCFEETAP